MGKFLPVKKSVWLRIIRIFMWIIVAWLAFFFAVILILNIPAVQTYVTGIVGKSFSKKFGTDVGVGAVKIAFPKKVLLNEVFLAGKQADTLLYIEEISINADLFSLLRQKIKVKNLGIEGLVSHISRKAPSNEFNFQFIIDAFVSADTLPEPDKKPAKPWVFDVQDISLNNIDATYFDEVIGLDARLDLGELMLRVKTLDFDKMDFDADRIDLSNTTANIEQWAVPKTNFPSGDSSSAQVTNDSEKSHFPNIKLGLLCMDNIKARYINNDTQQDFSIDLGLLEFTPKTLDFNHQKLELGELYLSNSTFLASMAFSHKTTVVEENKTKASKNDSVQSSIFPDWEITMDQLELDKINLKYDDVSVPKTPAGIDYSHLQVDGLIFKTGEISVSPEGLLADIKNASLYEQSGLDLKKLNGRVEFSDKTAVIRDLELETSKSNILGSFDLGFASLDDLKENLGQTEVSLDVAKLKVNTDDIFLFAPELASDSLLGRFPNETVIAATTLDGKINDLKIDHLDLWIFDFTKLKTHGRITGLPEAAGLGFDLTIENLTTNLADFSTFIDSLIPESITLPETFLIKGSAKGKIDDFTAEISLGSAFGDVLAAAFYQKIKGSDRDTFNVAFEIKELLVSQMLSDTIYGNLNATGNIAGTGAGTDSIAAEAGLLILEAGYNNYQYKNIETTATMNGAIYSAAIKSGDPNIRFDLIANANLSNEKQNFSTLIELSSLNLSALNFIKNETLISTTISAKANYTSPENMDVNLGATNTKLTEGKLIVPVNLLEMNLQVLDKNLEAGLKSDLLDISLSGNAEPQKLQPILSAMLNQYLGIADSAGVVPGTQLAFSVDVHLPHNIKKLIGKDFEISDIKTMDCHYNSDNNELSAEIQFDSLVYSGLNLDTLSLKINGKNDSISIDFDCRSINYDTVKIENFSINEAIKKGDILSEIKISDSAGLPRYLFLNEVKFADSSVKISFLPDGLILDRERWTVEKDNFIEFTSSEIQSQNFVFTNKIQAVGLNQEKENPTLEFTKFKLQNLLNIMEFKRHGNVLKGRLDGEIAFPGNGNNQFLYADLVIDSLFLMDALAGSFSAKAQADSTNLDLEIIMKNDANKISVVGKIPGWNQKPELDLRVIIDFKNMHSLEKYLMGAVSEMSGQVNGEVSVSGSPDKPVIVGEIGFDEMAVKITKLNFLTRLRNEKLIFDAGGLMFSNFVIEDAQQQKLTINGSILTENYSDFNFDLRLVTEKFQPINSTAEDNKTFFGKLNFDSDVKLKGTQKNPVIDASIKINNGTDLTYVLPGSELSLVTPEGIVHFKEKATESDTTILVKATDYLTDSIISQITGIDLTTNLEIDPDAKFTLVIDPKSGDYLTIGGSAILSIAVDPGGNQSMTGIYEVKTGVYQLSFYGLVKKSFTIKQGSNISWSGKPMDASLDITAEYVVTTSSVSLISNETNSMSDAEKNMYKQRLPYTVMLNIDGFLAQPEISFNITLPDKYMINYPQVASKLGQLNTPEMESERNKQVFGLLVTGSFIADNPLASTGTSTSSIATTAAINSVNGILADQLNNVSSKYVKGVDLDFGLNTYEDYSGSTSQLHTELDVKVSKKLFDDRLVVEAQGSFNVEGSKSGYSNQTSQDMWGEFAVIYSLDPQGVYKLRAYRENAYDFFDGEIAYSGVAFIYEKEFNSLKRKSKQERKEQKKERQLNKEGLKNNESKTGNE